MDIVTLSLARKKAKQYTDAAIGNLPKGVVYKGSVNYYMDLPNNAELGDCYTVLYKGTAETELSGIEYVWGVNTATGTNEWTAFGPDLSGYVKNTDYANMTTAGVVKINNKYGTELNIGTLYTPTKTYEQYQQASNWMFIGKGTLENVITGKQLVNQTYVDDLIGNLNSILDDINSEVV